MTLRLCRLLPLLALLLLSTTRAQGQVVLSDRSANGSLTVAWNGTGAAPANSVVLVSLPSQGSAAVQITGTFSATLSFEALIDQKNATWLAIKGTPFAGGTTVSAAAATGAWVFPLGGVKVFRVRCSAYTSGTALVGVVASSAINTGTIAGSSGGGGTATSVSAADEAAFTPGTDPFNPIGGLFNDSAAALTSGQQGIARLTPNRAQHVNLRNNAGTEIGTSTTPVRVDPTGTTPQPVSGTVAATQSGTWTVQPGNTANTTAWKVDGSAVTQPVSASALPLPAGAATETTLAAQSAKFAAGAAAADGFANPTTTQVEMFPFVWNGATWDRVKDMSAAQGQTTFTGVPAMAPFYLDTTGTPSVRRGVTAASITGSVTGTQIPASANALWDATVFRPQLSDTSGRAIMGAGVQTIGNVGGLTKNVDATLTRTANQTPYAANDEMTDTGGAIQTITGAATATGGSGIITHCLLSCSSNAATKPQLTVYVYDTTSTPAADNAVFAPSDAVQDTCVGSFQLNTAEIGDATSNTGNFTMDSGQIHIPYVTSGSANLFFRVKVNNVYTAGTNSDTYKFRWTAQLDAK